MPDSINERRYPPKSSHAELRVLLQQELAYVGYDGDTTHEDSPHHPAQALNAAQRSGDWLRYWKPRNFLAVAAEEPVGYLGQVDPEIVLYRVNEQGVREAVNPEDEEDRLLLARISTFVERKLKTQQADVVLWQGLYGQSFGKVIYDPGTITYQTAAGETETIPGEPAIHVIPYPRIEGGIERAAAFYDSEDPERITSAVVYWLEEERDDKGEITEQKYAQLLYPDRIEWLIYRNGGWYLAPERSHSGTGVDPHPWGVVPIAVCWNNGKPDLSDGIEAQAVINKDLFDMNAIADQAAFPQRYRKGVIPPGGWKRNVLTGEPETVAPLKSGPFIMWDVPLEGDVGQLDATEGTYLLSKYRMDVQDLATLTSSVAVSNQEYAPDSSGEAKSMDIMQQLKPRISRKAEGLGNWARGIFRILTAMCADPGVVNALGFDLRGYEVDVTYEVEIDKDEAADLDRDFEDVTNNLLSRRTYLTRRGMNEGQAERELARILEEEENAHAAAAARQERDDPFAELTRALGRPPTDEEEEEEEPEHA